MKRILKLICAVALPSGICAMFTACNEPNGQEQNEEGTDVLFTEYPLKENSLIPDVFKDVNVGTRRLIVVDSDEVLKNYIEGDYPPVDFSKNTLLLAVGTTGTAVDRVSLDGPKMVYVDGFRETATDKFELHVDVHLTIDMVPDRWCVAILTDKLTGESVVELSVKKRGKY